MFTGDGVDRASGLHPGHVLEQRAVRGLPGRLVPDGGGADLLLPVPRGPHDPRARSLLPAALPSVNAFVVILCDSSGEPLKIKRAKRSEKRVVFWLEIPVTADCT